MVLHMEDMVRPGRECKCGESRRSEMVNQAECVDGHRMMCKACARAKAKAWKEANPERKAAADAAWAQAHPEQRRQASNAWYARNADRVNAKVRALPNDSVANAAKVARRRSRLALTVCEPAATSEVASLSRVCPCGAPTAHLDHVVPVAAGGCANLHNLQWLCARCNLSKAASVPPPGVGCPVVNPS